MLQKGSVIHGKWTKHQIQVVRVLGEGANGQVYLVRYQNRYHAMKIYNQPGDIALEWGILEQMHHISSFFPHPVMIDDCIESPLYFYLMGWINGQTLDSVILSRNAPGIRVILSQILSGLHELHRTSHAFCDVKPQNIMLENMDANLAVRFVDVGGVTPFGRSVRQFTPYYDRAYWGLGQRIADAHYDICAVVLMFICFYSPPPKNLSDLTDKHRLAWLQRALNSFPVYPFTPCFQAVLNGKITDAKLLMDEINQISVESPRIPSKRHRKSVPKGGVAKTDWTERMMWGSICFAAVTTFAAWASFFGWF